MEKQREREERGDARNKRDTVVNRGRQGQRKERIARGFGQEVMSSRRSMPVTYFLHETPTTDCYPLIMLTCS